MNHTRSLSNIANASSQETEICMEEVVPGEKNTYDIDKTKWEYIKVPSNVTNGLVRGTSSSLDDIFFSSRNALSYNPPKGVGSWDLSPLESHILLDSITFLLLSTTIGRRRCLLFNYICTFNFLALFPLGHNNALDLDNFLSKKGGAKIQNDKKVPKRVRSFYRKQDMLIKEFEEHIKLDATSHQATLDNEILMKSKDQCIAKVTFFINLGLMIIKAVASALSGSLAIVSSLVDSCVDLVSGIIIWYSNRASRKPNIYHYPQGRTRLEPIGLVILSSIMAIASFQIIFTSIGQMIKGDMNPKLDLPTIIITLVTIVTKLVLWIVLRKYKSPGAQVLTMDQRNDFFSNSVALFCAYIGFTYWRYADPIGALLIAIYIAMSWWLTGYKQIQYLTGHTAQSKFLQLITWICLNHDEKILKIDTVRAFHFGNNFLVEVDIMLPETMVLKEAHDIGEKLQVKLEGLPQIERAFVHLDYETEHRPCQEHKLP